MILTAVFCYLLFILIQTITGLTAEEFNSDVKYAQALKSAIVSSITSPPIDESNVRNLTVINARRMLRSVHLQSGGSIAATYSIVVSTPYPAEAFSQQLNDAVSSGGFTADLQASAESLLGSDSPLATATAPSLVLGKYAST